MINLVHDDNFLDAFNSVGNAQSIIELARLALKANIPGKYNQTCNLKYSLDLLAVSIDSLYTTMKYHIDMDDIELRTLMDINSRLTMIRERDILTITNDDLTNESSFFTSVDLNVSNSIFGVDRLLVCALMDIDNFLQRTSKEAA